MRNDCSASLVVLDQGQATLELATQSNDPGVGNPPRQRQRLAYPNAGQLVVTFFKSSMGDAIQSERLLAPVTADGKELAGLRQLGHGAFGVLAAQADQSALAEERGHSGRLRVRIEPGERFVDEGASFV